jgi:hypothetical protein
VITNRTFGFLAFALGLAGCGDTSVAHVQGTVNFKGQPLPAGQVWFDPDNSIAGGQQGWARIKDGQYTTANPEGKGVKPGKYTVRIEGFDGKPGNELPMGKKLFTDFSEVKEVAGPSTTLDFDIKKTN